MMTTEDIKDTFQLISQNKLDWSSSCQSSSLYEKVHNVSQPVDRHTEEEAAVPSNLETRAILPGEKALIVDRFNIKIIFVPYTNKQKSQIGEFGSLWAFTSQPPVAVA